MGLALADGWVDDSGLMPPLCSEPPQALELARSDVLDRCRVHWRLRAVQIAGGLLLGGFAARALSLPLGGLLVAAGTSIAMMLLVGSVVGDIRLTRRLEQELSRARALHLAGQLEAAEARLVSLASIPLARPFTLLQLARVKTTQGDLDAALSIYSHLYRHMGGPFRPICAVGLARVYARKGRIDDAWAAWLFTGSRAVDHPETEALMLCREHNYEAVLALDADHSYDGGHPNELLAFLYAFSIDQLDRRDEMAHVYERCIGRLDYVSRVHVDALVACFPQMRVFADQLPWPERDRGLLRRARASLAPARVVREHHRDES